MRNATTTSSFRQSSSLLHLLLLTVILVSTSCSTGQQMVRELPPNPIEQGYILVPNVVLPEGKLRFDCGPEALTAVLNFYGDPISVEETTSAIYSAELRGTLSITLAPFARSRGFEAVVSRGTLQDIESNINAGIPTIIMVDVTSLPNGVISYFLPKGFHHFFLISGYNPSTQEVVCEYYEGKKHLIYYDNLKRAWEKDGFFMLTIRPGRNLRE